MARKRRAPTFAGALAQPIYVDVDQIERLNEVLLARMPEKMSLATVCRMMRMWGIPSRLAPSRYRNHFRKGVGGKIH
jgi:hypothetical protein